ncbi:MAG: Abi family protein, partial [Phocaeicola sp.]
MKNIEARSIKEQIKLLKERGMTFTSEEKAAGYLSHISYYRLKGYWWEMQEDKKVHQFKQGSCFDEVINRYHFDKDLRIILFDAIETIEIALRTKIIYHLSLTNGGLWYLKKELFEDEELHAKHLEHLQKEFARSGEIFATEYKKKHPTTHENSKIWESDANPDAWIIFEVATIG